MANEKRLIDANDPLKQLSDYMEKLHCSTDYIDGLYRGMEIAESYIKNAPTVDAIVSPVKIGQVLWCNIPHSKFPLECRVYCICREERNGLVLDYFRCVVKGWFGKAFGYEDVGKTVFLTREEAVSTLAKMDGGNEE